MGAKSTEDGTGDGDGGDQGVQEDSLRGERESDFPRSLTQNIDERHPVEG
jgi:hypothetical protein